MNVETINFWDNFYFTIFLTIKPQYCHRIDFCKISKISLSLNITAKQIIIFSIMECKTLNLANKLWWNQKCSSDSGKEYKRYADFSFFKQRSIHIFWLGFHFHRARRSSQQPFKWIRLIVNTISDQRFYLWIGLGHFLASSLAKTNTTLLH